MTQIVRKFLVIIQTVIAVLTLVMLAAGLFGVRATDKIGEQQRLSELNFEEKMRPSIGQPYTEQLHYKLLELMRASDEVNASSNEACNGASKLLRNLGGLLFPCALASIFFLVRKPTVP